MLDLSKETPIGKGTNRECFIHPNDEMKCIKITYTNDFQESEKEIAYYKFIEKEGFSLSQLPKYYGKIKTSRGEGEVFDLIRDYDGNISKTLTYYVQNIEKTKEIQNPIYLLKELQSYCIENRIVIKDLNSNNIMYQKLEVNRGNLIIIDGFSNPKRVKFLTKFGFYLRKKQLKDWNKFLKLFFKRFDFNTYLLSLNSDFINK